MYGMPYGENAKSAHFTVVRGLERLVKLFADRVSFS